MRLVRYGSRAWREYLASLPRAGRPTPGVERTAAAIVRAVRSRGDRALVTLTARLDRVSIEASSIRATPGEIRHLARRADPAIVVALRATARRIETYHRHQSGRGFSLRLAGGGRLEEVVTPLRAVGLYVPGGAGAYPSSVLMNAIPARVAGVPRIAVCTPPRALEANPAVAAALVAAGVESEVYRIGGAQAVAALAYGTASVPRVDKIVGPGNAYVAEAKRQVFGQVGIDMIAGPSEILVIGDGSAPADWAAMDLFSQAEHDELAQAILLSPKAAYLDQVEAAIRRLIGGMPRRKVIAASLAGRGALVLTRSLNEACEIANRIAPEHLELSVAKPRALLPKLRHAGAIFLGRWSSEAIGDYCAGPNHILPTSGTARFSSPLGVYDFQKRSSLIQVSRTGARRLGRLASTLARGEGLYAHAQSAEMRTGSR